MRARAGRWHPAHRPRSSGTTRSSTSSISVHIPLGVRGRDRCRAGRLHPAVGLEPRHPLLVVARPHAALAAGREPHHRARVVHRPHRRVHPAPAQRLDDLVLVAHGPVGLAARRHQPHPGGVAVVGGQPGRPLLDRGGLDPLGVVVHSHAPHPGTAHVDGAGTDWPTPVEGCTNRAASRSGPTSSAPGATSASAASSRRSPTSSTPRGGGRLALLPARPLRAAPWPTELTVAVSAGASTAAAEAPMRG